MANCNLAGPLGARDAASDCPLIVNCIGKRDPQPGVGVTATPFGLLRPSGAGATALNYHVDKSKCVPSSRGVLNDDAVGGQDWTIGKVQQSDERR